MSTNTTYNLTDDNLIDIRATFIVAAFFNNDWCPGTSLFEVMDDYGVKAINAVAATATKALGAAGMPCELDRYDVAACLWDAAEELKAMEEDLI